MASQAQNPTANQRRVVSRFSRVNENQKTMYVVVSCDQDQVANHSELFPR